MKKNSIFEKYKFQNFLANIIPTVPILLGSLKKSQPIRSCRLVCYMEHIYKCLIIQAVLYHIFTKYLQYFSFFSTVYIKKLIIHGKLNFSFPVFFTIFFLQTYDLFGLYLHCNKSQIFIEQHILEHHSQVQHKSSNFDEFSCNSIGRIMILS